MTDYSGYDGDNNDIKAAFVGPAGPKIAAPSAGTGAGGDFASVATNFGTGGITAGIIQWATARPTAELGEDQLAQYVFGGIDNPTALTSTDWSESGTSYKWTREYNKNLYLFGDTDKGSDHNHTILRFNDNAEASIQELADNRTVFNIGGESYVIDATQPTIMMNTLNLSEGDIGIGRGSGRSFYQDGVVFVDLKTNKRYVYVPPSGISDRYGTAHAYATGGWLEYPES
jgi:hypothetical protein